MHWIYLARWGTDRIFACALAALLKTSLSVPVVDGELVLGTWQQVLVINLDNRERMRELVTVIVGSGLYFGPAFLCWFQYLSST